MTTLPPSISHERCSELLRPFAGGRLTSGETAAVEAHLEVCRDCRTELVAVRSLLAAPVGAMDDLERARLRAGVAAGLRPVTQNARPEMRPVAGAPSRPAGRRGRVQPGAWLGVAATALILFAAGLVYLGGGMVTEGGSSDQGGAAGFSENSDQGGGAARADAAADEGAPAARLATGPLAVRSHPEYTEGDLGALGRTVPVFGVLARLHGPRDVGRLQAEFAGELVRELGGAPVRSCLTQALAATPDGLPVYGALGALEGRPVLVLGLVVPGSSGARDRFVVKWWSAPGSGGAECPSPLGAAGGVV